jgi:hypothetical protein
LTLLLVGLAGSASAAVTRDPSVGSAAASFNLNVPVAPAWNVVTVTVSMLGSGATVTLNGYPLTLVNSRSLSGLVTSNIFWIADNTGVRIKQGTNLVAISGGVAVATPWRGVGTIGPTGGAASNAASTSHTLTITEAGSGIVDSFTIYVNTATQGAGQTLLGSGTGFNMNGYASGRLPASAGTYTMGWSSSSSQNFAHASIVLRPVTATKVVIQGSGQTVTAGQCSGTATVQLQNAANVGQNGAPTAVALSSTDGTMLFYDGAGCSGAPVTSVSVGTGISTAPFSYRTSVVGSPTITASVLTLTSGNQAQTIIAADPTALELQGGPQTVTANVCSATVTAQLRDAGNNPANGKPTQIDLSGNDGAVQFFMGAGCSGLAVNAITVGTGATSGTFSFRTTVAGTLAVSATAFGLTGDS